MERSTGVFNDRMTDKHLIGAVGLLFEDRQRETAISLGDHRKITSGFGLPLSL